MPTKDEKNVKTTIGNFHPSSFEDRWKESLVRFCLGSGGVQIISAFDGLYSRSMLTKKA